MKTVAFLPAKGTSSRIENKNIKLLDGQPLFLYTLKKLLACHFIDEVYLDTENPDMMEMARDIGASVLQRDAALADNSTDGNALMRNECSQVDADIYLQVLCTSPFIENTTYQRAVEALSGTDGYDSAALVRREKLYLWEDGRPAYRIDPIPNSVDLPETVIETMGMYAVTRECILNTGRRIGDRPLQLEARPLEAIDVNVPDDFAMANLIAAGLRESDRRLMQNLKEQLCSAMLSDILDDLGHENQIIKSLQPNLACKLLGRAKTLHIRKLHSGEDFRGIYQALESYDTIVPNDIILVQNDAPEYAYFGELNANLAIRSGATGAIIGGKTRDGEALLKLGFPVFSSGLSCQDVRRRATLESVNRPIFIDDVQVRPDQLIFADCEGIVVIPTEAEQQVLERCMDTIRTEKKVLLDISLGTETSDLVKRYGVF